MSESIPGNVVRNIIADILFERANNIDDAADELIKKELKYSECISEYPAEVGWTACGTRVLSDDIREGIMSIEEAVEALTPFERKEAKRRCQEWLEKRKENLER